MDRLKELQNFVLSEIELFRNFPDTQFNQGVIAGLSLVKGYAESAIEAEGKKIAEALDVKS